jgi:acyl carrier protein
MQDIQDRIKELLIKNLNVSESDITPEARIVEDLGGDSLNLAEITMDFEETFDITIPNEKVEQIKTFADAVKCIQELTQDRGAATPGS